MGKIPVCIYIMMCGLIEINMLEMSVFTPKCWFYTNLTWSVSSHIEHMVQPRTLQGKKNSLEEFLIEGEWEKNSQTFLVNNAKLVNPIFKPQA